MLKEQRKTIVMPYFSVLKVSNIIINFVFTITV
jgi:hypothetical protein